MSSPYLSLDIGSHHTGVAVSESGLVAQPLEPITTTPPHRHGLLEGVAAYVKEYNVQTVIIGVPYTIDDNPTTQSNWVEAVTEDIKHHLTSHGLTPEIELFNEHGTTRDGKVRHPELDDNTAAATILLQDYLDTL